MFEIPSKINVNHVTTYSRRYITNYLGVCMCNKQQNFWLKNLSHGSCCAIKMADANLKAGNVAMQFLMRFCFQWKISATLVMTNIMDTV